MNKKTLTKLTFLVLLATNSLYTHAQENVKYYRHMVFRASPYAKLMGRHPVELENIGLGNYYKIYTNNKGKNLKIEHWSRNKISRGGYNRFGAIAGAASLIFEYRGNKTIRKYLDEQGKPMLNYWKVAVEEIALDANGYKKSMIYKDIEGKRIEDSRGVWITKWSVNKDGKEVIEERMGKDGISKRFNNFLDFRRVKMIFDDNHLRYETWNIDNKGNRINSEKRQVSGVYTRWDTHDLDEKEITWVDTNGNPKNVRPFEVMKGNFGFCKEIYTHDENGYITSVIKYDTNNKIKTTNSDGNVFNKVIFDSYGFPIDQRFFNEKGIPALNNDGIGRIELIRDSLRLVKEVRFFGLNGELKNRLTDKVAIIKLQYDKNGNFISRQIFDSQGNELEIKN